MVISSAFQQDFLRRLGQGLPLADLFDYLPEVYLYVKDRRSRFVQVNRALAAMHGCSSSEQMIGKTDYDFHPRHLADQYVEEDRRVIRLQAPIPNQVWLVSDHQGDLKWYVSTKIPLFDESGRVIGIAGVMRDFAKAESLVRPYQQMEEVLSYVLHHYDERIPVTDLAHRAHLSVSQFDRKFQKTFQMTPQQYILRVRNNAACQALLFSSQSIASIAQQTGFYDQSYFTKQFRKQMGLTPSAYRKKYSSE